MKLYYSPGACSLSPHIILRELGLPFSTVRIDGKTHLTETGADYYAINPKGQVPAIVLDNGQLLTEGAAVVQYLADQKPEAGLAPRAGTWERYKLQEWLNFVGTEIHKGFSPLFNSKLPGEARTMFKERLATRFDFLDKELASHDYLMGSGFSVVDAYLFAVLRWARGQEIDLARWPGIAAFMSRMRERPAVKAALAAEGLT
jgi:glutathione S-transferase